MQRLMGNTQDTAIESRAENIGIYAGKFSMRIVKTSLIIILITLALAEAMLRIFDPLGIRYFDDLSALYDAAIIDRAGYALPAGEMKFSHWRMNISENGTRFTPSQVAESSRVLFFGDSVTMCWGVNDDECWVNIVAARLGIDTRNYGRSAYNADNSRRAMLAVADTSCAVFLAISNDDEYSAETIIRNRHPADGRAWLLRYYIYSQFRANTAPAPKDPAYLDAMQWIADRPDTLIIAYGEYGVRLRDAFPDVVVFDAYTHRISHADPHPDARGNIEIADAVTPIIADWLAERTCT